MDEKSDVDSQSGSSEEFDYVPRTDGTFVHARMPNCDLVPEGLTEHTSVPYLSTIYVFGGRIKSREGAGSDRLLAYSYEGKSWSEVEKKGEWPPARSSHSATIHESSMFVFGGRAADGGLLNDLWEFDFVKRVWTQHCVQGDKPQPRFRHGSLVRAERLFVFGGQAADNDNMWSFDVLNQGSKWSPVECSGYVPVDCFNSYVLLDDSIYATDSTILKESLLRYDFSSSAWTKLNDTGVDSHSMTKLNKWLYITCGYDSLGPSQNMVRSFDITATNLKPGCEWGFIYPHYDGDCDDGGCDGGGDDGDCGGSGCDSGGDDGDCGGRGCDSVGDDGDCGSSGCDSGGDDGDDMQSISRHSSCVINNSLFIFGGMGIYEHALNHLWEIKITLSPEEAETK